MKPLARRLTLTLLSIFMVVGVAAPSAVAGSYENEALSLLNAERAAAGLAPVVMHSDLTDDALAWSRQMMSSGNLSHNPNLSAVTVDWDKLGENVGVGTSVVSLHEAFMNSPSHRGNILGDYDSVGIAVVEETSSKIWITVVFMKSLKPVESVEPAEDQPEPYSSVHPTLDNDQPAATQAAEPIASPAVAAAPTPRASVIFVQSGLSPIAD